MPQWQATPGRNSASLKAVAVNTQCGSAPTWLDLEGSTLFCVDEGFSTPNASVNTLTISADGSLKAASKVDTIQGPVSDQIYNDGKALALAHYGGSAVSTYKLSTVGGLTPLQNFVFSTPPGPRPEQEASHVHEAIIDPTKEYLFFPDLGADVVRIYKIDPATSLLTEQPSLKADAASGPRHAVFWSPSGMSYGRKPVYLFVIHELANKIVSWKVNYATSGLTFTRIQDIGLYGTTPQPNGTRAAEIVVSPDNRFIISSNRNATIFSVPNPDPSNSTKIPSDSLTTFTPSEDGKLTFQSLSPSGGSFPRHFSLNKDGSMVAVGNQNSGSVVVWMRDVKTGKFGDRVATAENLGQVTNVIWDERK
ncbi:3-carboxymuconate cyclase-like protein-like protein [Lindgomyces ingoldianus]|uniref:3-carboxymuconate cyclase-like protein-like protein n=1 Tax=Lindgomyces ingoldianus TaxID=673940 RepID=A0ACB6QJP5_9PLEO|nr:3-carboxymuconate cyclase-like protein-like protein [Lindgomyces ingoldianus]KAF2467234.1 3-carboxymuconate cyclase-like protein-like protein [Lindgomyces ingoldianus]